MTTPQNRGTPPSSLGAPTQPAATSLEHLVCAMDDIFQRHFLPYLTARELGRLEVVSGTLRDQITRTGWKMLCQRDFPLDDERRVQEDDSYLAPVYSAERRSFDRLESFANYKLAYEKWNLWNSWTGGGSQAKHLVQSIGIWDRLKAWLRKHGLDNVLSSLLPCAARERFGGSRRKAPSSLLAFYSVHEGQAPLMARSPDTEFFAGILGGYACYNSFYSMRLMPQSLMSLGISDTYDCDCLVAISPGNPRSYLCLYPTENDPEGELILHGTSRNFEHGQMVGQGGILSYFQAYVERLENNVYEPAPIIPTLFTSRGISLYPSSGPTVSSAVTRGIEVKASARWFPSAHDVEGGGLNFGYSIRIRMVEEDGTTCQLVGRHWAFTDGNGSVRRVEGEGVIGKQPLFFCENGKSGFFDLGQAGDEVRYADTTFYYQSQSGPVAGTTSTNTGSARVEGTFSFVPGSIDDPTGPMFHVTVAPFPLSVSFPFF